MRTIFILAGLMLTLQASAATLYMCDYDCEAGVTVARASGGQGGVSIFAVGNQTVGDQINEESDAMISPTDLIRQSIDPEDFAKHIAGIPDASIYCYHSTFDNKCMRLRVDLANPTFQ